MLLFWIGVIGRLFVEWPFLIGVYVNGTLLEFVVEENELKFVLFQLICCLIFDVIVPLFFYKVYLFFYFVCFFLIIL